ncbi:MULTISPECIES: XRE family transcriptional regulator [unclassified Halomonas]|uniref:XRE family transcriptional regulator n=1 Tax=unclassified Halomonas TaxID=2609666 RepID=UPI002883E3BA|nr:MULTISPECIES: XRE family transcriptional regulator [unclassified Halomonas]MDT0501772.1 XRE family transcriptional regulator [Halomonas sp. PAR7]MDT0513398.1 XRE family transcriptional regulator [Halomonas sp. LES1]MDT0591835.1 XRE family transcriptional regulator [Halomonas sp. PAR8]
MSAPEFKIAEHSTNIYTDVISARLENMTMKINYETKSSDYIVLNKLVDELHITKEEFAAAAGLRCHSIIHKHHFESAFNQQRLYQIIEILKHIEPWAGSLGAAWSWYRSYPIFPLGGLTAEELITQGRASDVHEYLYHIAEAGYA